MLDRVMFHHLLPEQCSLANWWLNCSSEAIWLTFPGLPTSFYFCIGVFYPPFPIWEPYQHGSSRAHLPSLLIFICRRSLLLDCLLDVLWCHFQLSGKDKAFELCKIVSSSEPISCGLRTTSVGSMVCAGPSDTAPNHLAWVLGHNQSGLSCW